MQPGRPVVPPVRSREPSVGGRGGGLGRRVDPAPVGRRGSASAGSARVGSPSAERSPPARAAASRSRMRSSGAGWPVHSSNAAAPWWRSISSPSATVGAGRRGVAQEPRPGVDEVHDEEVAGRISAGIGGRRRAARSRSR